MHLVFVTELAVLKGISSNIVLRIVVVLPHKHGLCGVHDVRVIVDHPNSARCSEGLARAMLKHVFGELAETGCESQIVQLLDINVLLTLNRVRRALP